MESSNVKRPLSTLTNRELIQELFQALTDIEKTLFKTFLHMLSQPEVVFHEYMNGNKTKYFSVFRYFLLSIFISFIGFNWFYHPGEIGGEYYNLVLNSHSSNYAKSGEGEFIAHIDIPKFNEFYIEFTRLMQYFYKLFACFNIPALFLSLLLLFRKLKLNMASLLVISVFMSSESAILGTLIMTPLKTLLTDNFYLQSVISMVPILVFFTWCFYRLGKPYYKRPLLRGLACSISSLLVFLFFNMSFGAYLSIYVHAYTPSYVYKEYPFIEESAAQSTSTENEADTDQNEPDLD